MVDVSARARRHAARVRMAEFVPAAPSAAARHSRTGAQPRTGAHSRTGAHRTGAHRTGALPTVRQPAVDDLQTERFAAVAPASPLAASPLAASPPGAAPPGAAPLAAALLATAPPAPRPSRHRVPEQSVDGPAAPERSAGTRVGVRAVVLAMLLALVGGGAGAVAMGKTVVLNVDGAERTVHTFAGDVAGALAAAGMTPAPQDRVQPALPTELADGDYVIVNRARPLILNEGGTERRVWTTAGSVQEALANLGMAAQPMQMSVPADAVIPLAGMSLELTVPRGVTLADGPAAVVPLTTTAGTVAGLLDEQGIVLGPDDVAVPSPDTVLDEGMAVQIVRNGSGEVIETRVIEPPEEIVEDPELARGEREIVEPGRPGEQTVVMRVDVQNGQEVGREQVRAGSITPSSPRVVHVGTNDEALASEPGVPEPGASEPAESDAPTVSDGGVWDRLAQCEATGNWSINTGNGYYGGLQFNRSTWNAYDGDQYAALPHQASREEQIAVASTMRDDRGGYGAWPACSRKLGLPR